MLNSHCLNYIVEINWEIYLKGSIDKCNLNFLKYYLILSMFVM